MNMMAMHMNGFVFYELILTENGCDEKSFAGDGESLDQVDSSCSVVLSSQKVCLRQKSRELLEAQSGPDE